MHMLTHIGVFVVTLHVYVHAVRYVKAEGARAQDFYCIFNTHDNKVELERLPAVVCNCVVLLM